MSKIITVNERIKNFNKKIIVPGDKSLSIRWALFSSIAKGKSKAYNLLLSEDVLAAINAIKKEMNSSAVIFFSNVKARAKPYINKTW